MLNKIFRQFRRIDAGPSQEERERVQRLTDEVARLQSEAIQVPILKAKLDILELELRKQKETIVRRNTLIERPGLANSADTTASLYNDPQWEFSEPLDMRVNLKNHSRELSDITMSTDCSKSVFSVFNNESIKSTAELELQLAYEETNRSLLEKLKVHERENMKLINHITQLEESIDQLKKKRVELEPPSEDEPMDWTPSQEDLIVASPTLEYLTMRSPTLDYLSSSSAMSPTFESRLTRNEFYNKTLRKKSSRESLLSLNKGASVQLSKCQYYIVDEKPTSNKRSSLVNYYHTRVAPKVSPRPKSVIHF